MTVSIWRPPNRATPRQLGSVVARLASAAVRIPTTRLAPRALLFRTTQLALAALLLFSLSGCGRKSGPQKQAQDSEPVSSKSAAPLTPQPEPQNDPTRGPAPLNETAPRSGIQRISGPDLLKQLAGSKAKATIVNAWASWCGPCRREFPMLIALRDNLASQGVEVVFVSVDEEDGEEAALAFAQENGLAPPVLVAERPLGPFKSALNPKWPGMLPATFLFDGAGKLRYFWGGPVYEQELLPIVERFLAGEHIDGEANFGLTTGLDFRHD